MADQPETLFAVAQSLEKQGDWAGAADQYRAVLAAQSDFLEAHHNLAIALRHLDQTDEALLYARSAAEIAPDHPTVQFSLGVSLEHEKEIEAAIEAYKRSVDLRPNYVTALNNLGRLLEVTGQIPESLEYLERALAMAPSNQSVRLNLANSYLQGGHPKKSLKILETLALESPELSIAHNSLGVAAHIIGDQPQSILHFRDAIKCEPDFAEAHENLAQALLFEEEYEEAWAEYEWRWQNDSNTQSKYKFKEPAWNGESLSGKTLLVHAEQGFGDVIQFARFLSMIEKHGSHLILACHSALIELLSQLKCVDQVVDLNRELNGIQIQFDYQAPLLSLPRILGVDGTNIPNAPYLSAESSTLDGDSSLFKIGFAWAGRPRHESDPHRNRSCRLFGFDALLNISSTQFYSLQTGQILNELANFDEFGSIFDIEPQINSFYDTARLISGLDLIIITVDTALAHLAGEMGKPVLILLATCADWRWQSKAENIDNNLWYQSARLFRQLSPGEWSDPLHDVETHIRDLIL